MGVEVMETKHSAGPKARTRCQSESLFINWLEKMMAVTFHTANRKGKHQPHWNV